MNELVKSLRIGTVEFFGILIPGVLMIGTCILGFIMPVILLISDASNVYIDWQKIYSENRILISFALIIIAYVLGYILRLSSPDKLDEESAKKVIEKERKKPEFEKDGWPYDPGNVCEKYPYSNFREYLKKRGHGDLTQELVTWGRENNPSENEFWPDEVDKDGDRIPVTKQSKTTINKMKMAVRIYSPELSGLIESKEGHIRLMAGTWTAFRYSLAPLIITLIGEILAGIKSIYPNFITPHFQLTHHYYGILAFINICLLLCIWFSMVRIIKLFHYRRVSELFHIVQAAYFVQK